MCQQLQCELSDMIIHEKRRQQEQVDCRLIDQRG